MMMSKRTINTGDGVQQALVYANCYNFTLCLRISLHLVRCAVLGSSFLLKVVSGMEIRGGGVFEESKGRKKHLATGTTIKRFVFKTVSVVLKHF